MNSHAFTASAKLIVVVSTDPTRPGLALPVAGYSPGKRSPSSKTSTHVRTTTPGFLPAGSDDLHTL